MTIWQDRAQIRELYREAERTLISNHPTTVWLPGSQDLDTLKLLSDLIGDQWVAAATVSAAPDGGLSASEGSERTDVAPPAFLRTLAPGTAVVLTGNTPPGLIRTHAYYEKHRWRRLVDHEELRRHADMHSGAGPTTARRWEEKKWPDTLPATPERDHKTTAPSGTGISVRNRGSVGRALAADHPTVSCNRHGRHKWGPGGAAPPTTSPANPASGHPSIYRPTSRKSSASTVSISPNPPLNAAPYRTCSRRDPPTSSPRTQLFRSSGTNGPTWSYPTYCGAPGKMPIRP